MWIRRAGLVMVLLTSACGSTVDVTGEPIPGSAVVTTCAGAIGSEPVVLADGLAQDGWLTEAPNALIYAHARAVNRVDPCTGEMEELATHDWIASTVVYGDHVYFVTHDTMGVFSWLNRVPLVGGEVDKLGDVGTSRIVASPRGVFAMATTEDAFLLRDVTEGEDGPVVVMRERGNVGAFYRTIGAGAAGVYVRLGFDAGSPIPFYIWPHEGSELVAVDGSEGGIALDVDGDVLVVLLETFEGGIVRVPLAGGEATPAVIPTSGGLNAVEVEATGDVVCWRGDKRAPFCLRGDQTAESAAIDMDPNAPGATSMLLTDALYWLRQSETGAELVAAIP